MSQLALELVTPQDLHDAWYEVEHYLEECSAKDPDNVWLFDIYAAVKFGHAFLYRLRAPGGDVVGAMLCNIVLDQFDGERRFNIWYLNCQDRDDDIKDTLPQVEAIARNAQCKKIIFSGIRPGFANWGKNLGFRLSEIRLEKDL